MAEKYEDRKKYMEQEKSKIKIKTMTEKHQARVECRPGQCDLLSIPIPFPVGRDTRTTCATDSKTDSLHCVHLPNFSLSVMI